MNWDIVIEASGRGYLDTFAGKAESFDNERPVRSSRLMLS